MIDHSFRFAAVLAANRSRSEWTPESEIALVEAVLLGETVELATSFQFKTQLESCTSIAKAADLVSAACQCGLMASMDLARQRLQELAAVSSERKVIAHAAFQLSQVVRYGDVRRFDPAPLLPLMEELFVSGALALHAAANCDNDAAREIVIAIEELNRVSLEHHDRVDEALWLERLRHLSDADDRNPLLSGFACATLLERNLIDNDEQSFDDRDPSNPVQPTAWHDRRTATAVRSNVRAIPPQFLPKAGHYQADGDR